MRILLISVLFFITFACNKNDQTKSLQNTDSVKQVYLQKGDKITSMTQAELLKNVSQAMHQGGPGYAVEFCNLRALFLKDSLSKVNDCEIRRLAEKYRNPLDMPQTETEKEQLKLYRQDFDNGTSLQSAVYLFDDRIEYYRPIMLAKETCLKCHGMPGTDIEDATMQKINERYPNDLATGFALNDFRGAWKVTFNK